MAQVKLLKINGDGVPTEFNSAADDITLNSFSVQGGGPSLSATGLNASNQDLSNLKNLIFTAPSTDTLNQTAGALIIDNIVAKERSNLFSTAGEVLFPVVTDTASTVDNFRIPQIAGAPTATPTNTGAGFLNWDTSGKKLWIWDGSWLDQSVVNQAKAIDDSYTAANTLLANDAVYISASNTVDKASGATNSSASFLLGFATAGAAAAASVDVRKAGVLGGFSSLTPGSRYYLSATTAGQITATLPTGAGNTLVQAGYAKSATQLDILIQQLGRRA